MIDVNSLVTGYVALLQAIPELVQEMANDATRIGAYTYRFPDENSLEEAIADLKSPGMLVAHAGTSPSTDGEIQCWRHDVTVFIRAASQDASQPPAYWKIHRLLWKGVPTGYDVPIGLIEVIPDCYAAEMPAMHRQVDAQGLDYFAIQTAFNEKGDE